MERTSQIALYKEDRQLKEKNNMKSIQAIHKKVLSTFKEHPIAINNGQCDAFMVAFIDALEENGYYPGECGSNWEWDEDCHFWTICNGKHYDSETPNGVYHPLDLPFFVRT